jgi:hypothetical protein
MEITSSTYRKKTFKRKSFHNTFFPSQVSIMRSDGTTGSPSFVHLTSGIGLPMKGAPSSRMSPSSVVTSRRPWINTGFSSGASPRPLSAKLKITLH